LGTKHISCESGVSAGFKPSSRAISRILLLVKLPKGNNVLLKACCETRHSAYDWSFVLSSAAEKIPLVEIYLRNVSALIIPVNCLIKTLPFYCFVT
jgi:hypothetical protein